jgi:thiol-disulfide isomerase/thioredoxin
MRKFSFLLFAAIITATASLAQQSRRLVSNVRCDDASLARSLTADAPRKQSPQPQTHWLRTAPQPAPSHIISNQPDGQHYLYSRSGLAYLNTWLGVAYDELSGRISEMVFADDGICYLKNVISQYDCNSWVQGIVEGSTVSFTFPQPVLLESGQTFYATMMQLYVEPGSDTGYFQKDADQTLTLDYNPATGDITVPAGSPFATNARIIGLTRANGEWVGFGDWNMTLSRVNDEPVTPPDELADTPYSIVADGFQGTLGRVGFLGDDIYVQGLCPDMPDAWMKGTVSGTKATFPNGQFLGADYGNNRFVYLLSAAVRQNAEGGTSYALTGQDITFDYDAATQSLTGGSLFLTNAGKDVASPIGVYGNARIRPFTEVAATPVTPTDMSIGEGGFPYYQRGYGWGQLVFNLPCADAEGNYLMPEKLSYQLYVRVNGEERPITLSSNDYQNLPTDIFEEVPYTYSDDWDIYVRGLQRTVYYFVVGPEAYGVQAIYRGGGEERRSEIAWANVQTLGADIQPEAATPAYPDVDPEDVGGEIRFASSIGGGTKGYFGDWNANTYDVAIHVQDEALTGTYIEEISFPLMRAKDISGVKVWLSSQLRVEHNQNVPDLVSVDVETLRTGNITVKLDKPYIIPEEGVYVGYTLTVDETSYRNDNGPIRVISGPRATGFYLHTANGFLKWMDVAEGLDMSAIIDLKLGGSKVKQHAASPLDGESLFVRTGSDIKTTMTFVNHGASGITSLDVEYTLNGETTPLHITPKSPVASTFGLTTSQTVTLPAIQERGTYDMTLRVVKVNDQPNEDPKAEATQRFILISGDPKHRPLLEEYTGTWCGWCPRGFVALEKLAKLYPDDYVCVAYHNSDPMEITTQFPSPVSSYPSAWMDRGLQMDPYYGSSGSKAFGVLDDLKWRAEQFGVADIDLSATLSSDEKTVSVTANVLFPFSNDNAHYALEYLLVANGLTGEDGQWNQTNNYAGQNYGADMWEFQHAGNPATGLVFNDVVVMQSQAGGIDGSIPEKVEADKPVTHTWTFDLEKAVNTSGQPVIQDVNQLHVVVLLISKDEDDIVANANKCTVSTPVGIGTIAHAKKQPASVEYYDLQGRRMQQLRPGLNIIRYKYADGSSRTAKIRY